MRICFVTAYTIPLLNLGKQIKQSQSRQLDQARLAKKRQLSGSPSVKLWEGFDSTASGDPEDDDDEKDISDEDLQLSFLKKNGNKDKNGTKIVEGMLDFVEDFVLS